MRYQFAGKAAVNSDEGQFLDPESTVKLTFKDCRPVGVDDTAAKMTFMVELVSLTAPGQEDIVLASATVPNDWLQGVFANNAEWIKPKRLDMVNPAGKKAVLMIKFEFKARDS